MTKLSARIFESATTSFEIFVWWRLWTVSTGGRRVEKSSRMTNTWAPEPHPLPHLVCKREEMYGTSKDLQRASLILLLQGNAPNNRMVLPLFPIDVVYCLLPLYSSQNDGVAPYARIKNIVGRCRPGAHTVNCCEDVP